MVKNINFEDVEWQPMPLLGRNRKIEPERVYFSFLMHANKRCLKITIGEFVANKLGWKGSDTIKIMQHPDFEYSFLVVKSNSPDTYVLSDKTDTGQYYQFMFKWPGQSTPELIKTTIAKHSIIRKNQLVIECYPQGKLYEV